MILMNREKNSVKNFFFKPYHVSLRLNIYTRRKNKGIPLILVLRIYKMQEKIRDKSLSIANIHLLIKLKYPFSLIQIFIKNLNSLASHKKHHSEILAKSVLVNLFINRF